MDLTIHPKSLSGRETQGDTERGGLRQAEREGHCGTAIQSVGSRFKECGNQQMPTRGRYLVSDHHITYKLTNLDHCCKVSLTNTL